MSPDPLFNISNQIVLASGASRGIGRAIAGGFAERGATVIITGREQETLAKTAEELEGDVVPMVCDVSNPDDIRELVQHVIKQHERIDTLINIAGVNKRQRVETYTLEEYDFIVDINLRGAFVLSQEVGKHQLQQGSGCQINIDSLNSDRPLKGVTPYAISKAGMNAMTRALAIEWASRGVRVNGLAPGFILTDLTQKLWSEPTMKAWNDQNTPMARIGTPEDMVGTALFLASEAAAFITGQTIYVDGGFTAGVSWPIEL